MGSFLIKIATTRTTQKSVKMTESRVPVTMRDFFFDDPFFKNSWSDFDKVRNAMFEESRDVWKKFDEDFRNMACMSNNIMLETSEDVKKDEVKTEAGSSSQSQPLARQDSLSRYESGWMFPRRWMLPSMRPGFGESIKQLDLFKGNTDEEIRVKEDDKKMEISVDTAQYRPDELKVTVENGAVQVQGKHEEKAEDGTKMISRSFFRKWSLPKDAKPEDVVSNLSSDGVLVITASKTAPAIDVEIKQ